MVERRAFAAALGAALLAAAGCSDQGKVREEELTQLVTLLPGRYDNGAQVEADARAGGERHEQIALVIARVYTPRLGHHLFYVQEMAADNPQRVLSQKLYGFELDDKRGIVETVFEFAEPLRWRDGHLRPELFTSVVLEDVHAEGCQLLWKKVEASFIARHDQKVCPDPGGAAAPPQATLAVGALSVGDYKFRKGR